MRKFAGSVLVVVALLGPGAFGQARLVAPVDRFNFGVVPTNTVLTHHFWLKSVGQDTVRIDTIKTGCSCAISDLEKRVLPPGDSVLLGMQWDIKRSRGSVYRSPMIFFNGSDDALRVHLEGTIWDYPDSARPVSIKPFRFELSRASVKDIHELEFTLTNHSGDPLSIMLASMVPEQVELTVPDSVPAGGTARGVVRLKPQYGNEEFNTSITLVVGDRVNSRLTIPIRRKFY